MHDDDDDEPTHEIVPTVGPFPDCSVLLHTRSGVEHLRLLRGKRVTVGRGKQADLVLDSPVLSRLHVSFELMPEGVRVVDLGSHNGTHTGGKRVDHALLGIGETVEFGGVTASVVRATEGRLGAQVLKHEQFVERLEQSLASARTSLSAFTVALVALKGDGEPSTGAQQTFATRVRGLVRPIDAVGLFGPRLVEVLFAGASLDEAVVLARQLVRETGRGGQRVRCGIASFPDSATHADELLRLTEKAALEGTDASPIVRAIPFSGSVAVDELGKSPAMVELMSALKRVAKARVPVLVLGETGSGKEVVARALHRHSPRHAARFCAVNCGAISQSLLESVLFGHEKGAFTGAVETRKGMFEEASGGTLLLDEIGELSQQGQAALLRVLETGRFARVGSMTEHTADVRLVAATHRDLQAMVRDGRFREDLYFRLDTVTLHVPPLRQRGDDLRWLAEKFLAEARSAHGCSVEGFSAEAFELLRRYAWPGNVRELRNAVTRAALMATSALIGPEDLSTRIVAGEAPPPPMSMTLDELPAVPSGVHHKPVPPAERERILEALRSEGWNQSAAARKLQMPRRTLAYKMKVLGLTPEG